MKDEEVKLGEKIIAGEIVSLDDEKVEKLEKMSKSLKEVENNIKGSIVSEIK